MMSLMASFYAVVFPTRCVEEIWDLIELVSEGFPTYSYIQTGHSLLSLRYWELYVM